MVILNSKIIMLKKLRHCCNNVSRDYYEQFIYLSLLIYLVQIQTVTGNQFLGKVQNYKKLLVFPLCMAFLDKILCKLSSKI